MCKDHDKSGWYYKDDIALKELILWHLLYHNKADDSDFKEFYITFHKKWEIC